MNARCASQRATVLLRAVGSENQQKFDGFRGTRTWPANCEPIGSREERNMNGANQCGTYLQHIQAEHHRLNRVLAEIGRQFAIASCETSTQAMLRSIRDGLEDLLNELRRHFAEEEGGGCLDEAAARCPSLGPRARDLLHEHPHLDRELERLISTMKTGEGDGKAWQYRFETFAADLRAHECAENQVLQTAFGGEAADHDVEGNE